MGKKKKKPKVNHRDDLRKRMIEQGAYDGRFREKTVTLKKHKKVKHKKKIFEQD